MPSQALDSLPNVIQVYLRASLDRDAEAVGPMFATDVRVQDDGRTYVGHSAVMDGLMREAGQFTLTDDGQIATLAIAP